MRQFYGAHPDLRPHNFSKVVTLVVGCAYGVKSSYQSGTKMFLFKRFMVKLQKRSGSSCVGLTQHDLAEGGPPLHSTTQLLPDKTT